MIHYQEPAQLLAHKLDDSVCGVFVVCSQREQCNKNVYFVYLYYQLFCGSWSFSSRSLHTVNSQVSTQLNYNFSCRGAVDAAAAAAACRSL